MKLGLRQTLVALVAEGVTEADRLRKFALERLTANAACICSFELYRKIATDMSVRLVSLRA